MAYNDLRAAKNREDAAIRQRQWWPGLLRTKSRAIVTRPECGSRVQRNAFAVGMATDFPQFVFNPEKNWWEGPLQDLGLMWEEFDHRMRLSRGAREWLDENSK